MSDLLDHLAYLAILGALSFALVGFVGLPALVRIARGSGISPIWAFVGVVPFIGPWLFFRRALVDRSPS